MNVIEELEDVLRMEQEHLLAGEFSDLATLVDRKAELADRLARDKPNLSAEGYKRLVARAGHNEALLSSARRGLLAAVQQLRQAAEGTAPSTYSMNGERSALLPKPGTVQQKA
jgi:flagellar biosynthesis/type III secretory pathway chaperone